MTQTRFTGSVDQQPRSPHPNHHLGLLDLMGLREALDGLQDDGEAERGEEHGVDQRAHHLGPDPAERVFVGGLGLLRETHRHQSHDQRDHVRQRRDPAHHHLHDEKAEGDDIIANNHNYKNKTENIINPLF
uniref:Uncharacterized protein n=1 Tax=Sinocyclocheilus anshuiensis TaxID=1608454 RepID=A0A671QKJ4_9TELE